MRNAFHVQIGFTIMYLIGCLTGFAEFTLYSKIVGVGFISIIVGLAIGFAWEWLQALINPKVFDENDIERTIIGTVFGGIFSIIFPDVQWLLWGSCIISTFLIVKDLIFLYKIFKNK